MINEEKIENLTMAYITSYNEAMKQVKNPDFATQIAMGVLMIVNMTEQNNHNLSVKTFNPIEMIFSQIARQAQEEEEENYDGTENEAD